MGSASSARTRRLLRTLAGSGLAIGALATWALAAGAGGWDHLGDRGTPGTDSLDLPAAALEATSGGLYVGGEFANAGGVADADRIAKWNGSSWSAVGPSAFPGSLGRVDAIAVAAGRVFVGGAFENAGGIADADNLAVWNGAAWAPFCSSDEGPAIEGNVQALQIIDSTLYVGGDFQNGGDHVSADYLLACDLVSGASRTTVSDPVDPLYPFSGPVHALTADSDGRLYAGGRFGKVDKTTGADNVAYRDGDGWHAMGSGDGACECAIDGHVRALTAVGTDVYVGTDETDVADIAQADHVAKWNGSEWSAVGAGSGGGNGWFSTATSIHALTGEGSRLFATGTFSDANGDLRADNVAWFDGSAWHPLGSDGAGDGPWSGTGHALALIDRQLYAAGSFTSAGGDAQAHSVASFGLSQVIAYPTPTVTPGPSAVPTPTVTAGPSAVPTPTVTPSPAPDTTAPTTSLRAARINQAARRATFRFGAGEPGARFLCKLDKRKFKPCTSPKTYKRLKRGKHVFRVKARDRAGNLDRTPILKRFKIKR